MNISSRLAALEAAAEDAKNGKIRVTFRDGHVEHRSGAECIDLLFQSRHDITEFWAPAGSGHGLLPELLSDLLDI